MDNSLYRPRIIDSRIQDLLTVFGAVCIEGPKWCGKTWTAEYHAVSEFKVGDPSGNFQNRLLAQTDVNLVLQGEYPRAIDEWQEVGAIWDAVRADVDDGAVHGRYILTGSSTPKRKGVMHSGAGRIDTIRMYPMTLFESGDSSGLVSLKDIIEGRYLSLMTGEVNLQQLVYLTVRGGWPASIGVPPRLAGETPRSYIQALLKDDINRLDPERRYNRDRMERLLKSLARNETTTASIKTLKSDIAEYEGETIDEETISVYLDALRRLFIISDQSAFSTNIRSSVRIKQMSKRHLVDPSLSCAILKATPGKMLGDLKTYGYMFEAMCERDLRIYASSFGAELYHYQDYLNREIDAVIELPDGRWAAFEIKLGADKIDEGAESLLAVYNDLKSQNANVPCALCVICGMSNAAYLRPDGVYVVPITALKP